MHYWLKSGQVLTEGGTSAPVALSSAEFYTPPRLSISAYSLNFSYEQVTNAPGPVLC
jgi:hypothetical protein